MPLNSEDIAQIQRDLAAGLDVKVKVPVVEGKLTTASVVQINENELQVRCRVNGVPDEPWFNPEEAYLSGASAPKPPRTPRAPKPPAAPSLLDMGNPWDDHPSEPAPTPPPATPAPSVPNTPTIAATAVPAKPARKPRTIKPKETTVTAPKPAKAPKISVTLTGAGADWAVQLKVGTAVEHDGALTLDTLMKVAKDLKIDRALKPHLDAARQQNEARIAELQEALNAAKAAQKALAVRG